MQEIHGRNIQLKRKNRSLSTESFWNICPMICNNHEDTVKSLVNSIPQQTCQSGKVYFSNNHIEIEWFEAEREESVSLCT